jgi:hypothetical protein
MPNVNPKTGLAYGVISTRHTPYLLEDIQSHGNNVTMENRRKECRQRLRNVVCDYSSNVDEVVEDMMDVLDDYAEHYGEEDEYEAELEGTKYLLSWLGGAPLIWVIDSEWACYCNPCSPCVPGAGDLDTLEGSTLAHCMPPEEWELIRENGGQVPKTLINLKTNTEVSLEKEEK